MLDQYQRETAEQSEAKIMNCIILSGLRGITFSELLKQTSFSRRTLKKHLDRLQEEGYVEKRGRDVMRLWPKRVLPSDKVKNVFRYNKVRDLKLKRRVWRAGFKKDDFLRDYRKGRQEEDHKRYFLKFKILEGQEAADFLRKKREQLVS